MENLQELKERDLAAAAALETMTREQLLDRAAELEMYKDNNEFYITEVEHIINLGLTWLKANGKTNHYINIEKDNCKVVQKEKIEQTFI